MGSEEDERAGSGMPVISPPCLLIFSCPLVPA